MRNVKLTLEYDGTEFSGWQSQKQGERTVQSVVLRSILELTGERRFQDVLEVPGEHHPARAERPPSP